MRILIVRLSALGDVIHGLPAAARLKQAIPGVELTWLVETAAMEVLINNPAVDRVILFPKKEWKSCLKSAAGLLRLPAMVTRYVKDLKSHNFDAVIDLQGLLKSALLAVASGAPRRFGFKTGREGADLFLTDKLDVGDYFAEDRHVVDLNLQMAEFVLHRTGLSDKLTGGGNNFSGPPELAAAADSKDSRKVYATDDSAGNTAEFSAGTAPGSDTADGGTTTAGSTPKTNGITGGLLDSGAGETGDGSPPTGAPSGPISLNVRDSVHPRSTSSCVPAAKTHSYIYEEQTQFPLPAPSAESVSKMESLLNTSSLSSDFKLVLIPGTTWESKIWPIRNWAAFADTMRERKRCDVILVGGPSEINANKELEEMLTASTTGGTVLNLTGQTSLLDLLVLFGKVQLVVGADTGPLHLAAATGQAPVLAVHGSTPVLRNGPYGSKCRTVSLSLDCQPCFRKVCPLGTIACLNDLEPDTVTLAALAMVP